MAEYEAVDYAELLDPLCPEIEAEDPDERKRLQIEALRSLLNGGYGASVDRYQGKASEVVGVMRDWLGAFNAGEVYGYERTLFQGLAGIDHCRGMPVYPLQAELSHVNLERMYVFG
jgi:hypothetical protein